MFIRNSGLVSFVALTALFWHASSRAAEFTLDPSRTLVSFEMRSLGTTQRGEFGGATGTVLLDSAEERGEIDIVIDARSLKANTEATAKFVRGPALLNTAVHPEIAYQAQHVVFSGGRPARIEGELTMRGITRPVALYVSAYDCSGDGYRRCTMVATAYLKRSEFGMTRYRMFASDEVKLAIQAEGVSRSTPATRS